MGVPEESELREERQFDLMRERLAECRRGDVGLRTLLDDLYGLLDQLESTDRVWVTRFRDRVDDIEMVYAAALDSHGPGPSPDEYASDVDGQVAHLQRMLDGVGACG